MTFQVINFGAASDGSQGDTVRTAFTKINTNWALALEATVAASTYLAKASDGGLQSTGKVNAANNPNLMINGSGELGTAGWTFGASFGVVADLLGGPLNAIGNTASLSAYTATQVGPKTPAGVGVVLCESFDIANVSTAGTLVGTLAAYNSAGTFISNIASVSIPVSASMAHYTLTGTTPSGTASVAFNLVCTSVTAPTSGITMRRIKIEAGAVPSLYSQEANAAAFMDAYNAETVAGVKTFAAAPVFSAGFSAGGTATLAALAASGNATVGGTLGVTGQATFSLRPTFGGKVPYDTGNFNPATYLPLTGGVLTGTTISQATLKMGDVSTNTLPTSQGTFFGWNIGTISGCFFMQNNPGGGTGGYQFRSVNAGNTAQTGLTVIDAAGNVSSTSFNPTSDARLKSGITDIDCPERVLLLEGKSYTKSGQHEYGFIAQRVLEVMPELVGTFQQPVSMDPEDGTEAYYTLNYMGIIAPLLEVVKSLRSRLDALEAAAR